MFYIINIVLLALLCLWAIRAFILRPRLPKGTRWLPGPRGIPGIGRVWDLPREHSYTRFKKWSDKYGPIYQINIFGNNHVWLASDRIARDLLVTKGAVYSNRPMIMNLEDSQGVAAPEYLPLLANNDAWRRQRKFVHQTMSLSSASQFKSYPQDECNQFLAELLDDPANYENIMEAYIARIITRLTYGDVRHWKDVIWHSHNLLLAISPAAHLSNIIPQLRHLPMWLSPWKRAEQKRHDIEREFFLRMASVVQNDIKAGVAQPSFMLSFLEEQGGSGMDAHEGAYLVGMMALAGPLTAASAMMTYVLAMCLYPQWQAKVQHEIDTVVGDRPVQFDDSPRLPVLRAVIKEIIRWRPVTPSSIPHETTQDDIYNGYFVPKGTQGHHTRRNHFPDPEVYNPDRWLNPAYPTFQEPLSQYPSIKGFTTFGYGRRICQGMDLVEQELLIGIGNMAWAGSFRNKRDALGREIHNPAHDYTALLISRPKPLVFDLKPRSAERAAAIKQRWAAGREAEGTDRSEKGMVGLESAFVSRPPRDIGNLLSEKVEDQIQVERLTMEV